MDRIVNSRENSVTAGRQNGEKGSALVIALFVLALISVFVAFALSRTAAEAAAVGNETAEARTLYAAQGSLEVMTRNFNKVFERKLNPSQTDLDKVENEDIVPGISRALGGDYELNNELDQVSDSTAAVLTGGPYAGLYAIRDTWRLRTTATDPGGTQIRLTRNVLNNRIPIFQFGIFYDDDLELFRPPRFSFGGRVHSNRHFFVSPGAEGVYFDSRVTAAGHIITQTWRNGNTSDSGNSQTWIKNASGAFKQLLPTRGSVLNGTPNVFASGKWADPDMPSSAINSSFASQSAIFDGNLRSEVKQLKLPLKVGNNNADLIEMIKRGKEIPDSAGGDLAWNGTNVVPVSTTPGPAAEDNDIQRSERFANKTGLRVSLSDTKARLPGCATATGAAVTGVCGVRLDGHMVPGADGINPAPSPAPTPERSRGYAPKAMTDGYKATRVNGERLHHGNQVWIKVETVRTDDVTGKIITTDITEDFLSLGVTDVPRTAWGGNANCSGVPSGRICIVGYSGTMASNGTFDAPSSNLDATTKQTASTYPDSRSIIKLQRLLMEGPMVRTNSNSLRHSPSLKWNSSDPGSSLVVRYTNVDTTAKVTAGCSTGCTTENSDPNSGMERYGHLLRAVFPATSSPTTGANPAIVPFPIQLFDMREGLYYDRTLSNPGSSPTLTSLYPTANFGTLTNAAGAGSDQKVSVNGVMSMVDIDVANLRRFLRGDFDGLFPNGLEHDDIPNSEGWVLYVSDRRGDYDFDGEFDMEDVYGQAQNQTPTLQKGEDVNGSGSLNVRFCASSSDISCEAEKYRDRTLFPDEAAVNDHKYYRRGVRLINGTTLPGIYNPSGAPGCEVAAGAAPNGVCGFTVASENGVYVQGNYNATHVTSIPASGNTPFENYRPKDSATHIPASIVGDGVTILSNAWNDGKSFRYPYELAEREAEDTTIRFAMISGDTIATKEDTPNQGGISPRLNGGVHNFKRFLERWTNPSSSSWKRYLNYSGSLINLYNSRNANGSFKCCDMVYNPPHRNWVFDGTFLEPSRIPPGTPFFQYVQTTGFERSTE